jgi:hypothetical protein
MFMCMMQNGECVTLGCICESHAQSIITCGAVANLCRPSSRSLRPRRLAVARRTSSSAAKSASVRAIVRSH